MEGGREDWGPGANEEEAGEALGCMAVGAIEGME